MHGTRDIPQPDRHPRPDPVTLEHADRRDWRPWIAPERCNHVGLAFHIATPGQLWELCGACGTVLADDPPRCLATNKKFSRQCRPPARSDREYTTCAAHRPEMGR